VSKDGEKNCDEEATLMLKSSLITIRQKITSEKEQLTCFYHNDQTWNGKILASVLIIKMTKKEAALATAT